MKSKLSKCLLAGLMTASACLCFNAVPVTAETQETNGETTVVAPAETDVKFHFLNVNDLPQGTIGSADCILIEDNGEVMLIDAGMPVDYSIQKVTDYIDALGITRIDKLFLTHPHNDHAGGMPTVIAKYDIGTIYLKASDWYTIYQHEVSAHGPRPQFDETYLAAKRKLNSDGTTVEIVEPNEEGMKVTVNEDSYFEIFNCVYPWEDHRYNPEFNDFSMVIKYTHKDVSALLLSDVNWYYESSFQGKVGECEIFKVAHHGTMNSSSSDELYAEINAKVGIVTGIRANLVDRWNLGKLEADDLLESKGIECAITQDGDVLVWTDGSEVHMIQDTEE